MKIKLTDIEIAFLKVLQYAGYKYIAKDESTLLYAYKGKPLKYPNFWNCSCKFEYADIKCVDKLFKFVKWSDEEPYKIEDLLK